MLFEELVFGMVSASVFMVCAAPRLYHLCKSPGAVSSGRLHQAKLVLAVALMTV
ncbi:hypothetical protein E4U55_004747, partial [Claviceps digitariae]